MRDFTLKQYRELVLALQQSGMPFTLRHDVDKHPDHSLATAQMEAELGVKAVYYFRIVPESNDPEIIRAIAALGHEIGYHYEDLSLANGDKQEAIRLFEDHLTYFRTYYPVHRICMHGAPTSQYDGRDLWTAGGYDYHDYGIDYEPYFDEDCSKTLYLTDTGRRWDGWKVSVRDKVSEQERWCREGLVFHSTSDIIRWLQTLTDKPCQGVERILITTHPQRWTNRWGEWCKELIIQNVKNIIKRVLICLRGC